MAKVHELRRGMTRATTENESENVNFPLITFNGKFSEKAIIVADITVFNGELSVLYENKILCPFSGCKDKIERLHGKKFTSAFVEIVKEVGETIVKKSKE